MRGEKEKGENEREETTRKGGAFESQEESEIAKNPQKVSLQ